MTKKALSVPASESQTDGLKTNRLNQTMDCVEVPVKDIKKLQVDIREETRQFSIGQNMVFGFGILAIERLLTYDGAWKEVLANDSLLTLCIGVFVCGLLIAYFGKSSAKRSINSLSDYIPKENESKTSEE